MVKASPSRVAKKKAVAAGQPIRLDLGCGDSKRDGFIGVDKFKTPSVDVALDLTRDSWPWKGGEVEEIHCAHFFEHLDGRQRILFMEECWRILRPDAQMLIIVPHWSSMRSVQDPFHAWPPVCETSFLYFNRGWREQNRLTHGDYDIKTNFDFGYGYGLDPDVQVRAAEYQQYAVKFYNNAVMDLHVTLTRRA